MTAADVVKSFLVQAKWCRTLGSELYTDLLEKAAVDLQRGGPMAAVVEGWEGDPFAAALPLRLLGGVHHLVLDGSAPSLAPHYPSVGGCPEWPAAGDAFLAVVEANTEALRADLRRQVQTNEVGRSAVALGGLLTLTRRHPQPVRLFEIGASAGLNVAFDRYRYRLGVGDWGPERSPVRIWSEWRGRHPALDGTVTVVERAGCDVAPVDVRDPEQRRRLESFVWPDQVERLTRLRTALGATAADPPALAQANAADWLPARLAGATPGTTTVVMHTVVWQYLGAETQAAVVALMEQAGAAASADAPLAWLSMEPRRHVGMEVRLRVWPDGSDDLLGVAQAHGTEVDWKR